MDRFHVCTIASVIGVLAGSLIGHELAELHTISKNLDGVAEEQQEQFAQLKSLNGELKELHERLVHLSEVAELWAANTQIAVPEPPSPEPPPVLLPVKQAVSTESWLNINSVPPSSVFVDGELLGDTPQLRVRVKPGSHTVTFLKGAKAQVLREFVTPGETKTAAFRFPSDDGF
jgi:hypothetical protein